MNKSYISGIRNCVICSECSHNEVCMYKNTTAITSTIRNIQEMEICAPAIIDISCAHFQKKCQSTSAV